MAGHSNAAWLLGALLMGGAGMAQAQAVTAADYARAAKMLGDRTGPLVDHVVSGASWLDDGTLVYREQAEGKTRALRFDPATGKTTPAFDAKALADAMNAAAGGKGRQVQADKLPPMTVKRNADGSLTLTSMFGGNAFRCEVTACTAVAQAKATSGSEPGAASPDGSRLK